MLSTNQLPKQGSYWTNLLLEEEKNVLFSSFADKISEEVEFYCTFKHNCIVLFQTWVWTWVLLIPRMNQKNLNFADKITFFHKKS